MLSHITHTLKKDQAENRMNVGIDMGKTRWEMNALDTATGKQSRHTLTGHNILEDATDRIKTLLSKGHEVDVIYEAGRNGFTPAREFAKLGANVTVVPVNKLEVVNTGKKAKSDRLDAKGLSQRDARAADFPSVWVPSVDQECKRRMLHEQQRMEKDIKRNNNRILAILERWPMPGKSRHMPAAQWKAQLQEWREAGHIGTRLPETEALCIVNMIEEIEVQEKNLERWQAKMAETLQQERVKSEEVGQVHPVDVLMQYRGIGPVIALTLAWYVGDFKRFGNGKQFSSYIGLTPVPWSSGGKSKCQGISKSGNPELRRVMIQLAWLWVRYQGESPITRKWTLRLKDKGRGRKTAIVAVARQLSVAIFRLLKLGEPLQDAKKNKSVKVPAAISGSPLAA
jgi:transposase